MSPQLECLGVDRMTVEERHSLIGDIWDSIEEESRPLPISDELKQELKRRIAEHEANPNDVIPWENIEAEARARFRR